MSTDAHRETEQPTPDPETVRQSLEAFRHGDYLTTPEFIEELRRQEQECKEAFDAGRSRPLQEVIDELREKVEQPAKTPGQVAYEAYWEVLGKSHRPIPKLWSRCVDQVAWQAAAAAVIANNHDIQRLAKWLDEHPTGQEEGGSAVTRAIRRMEAENRHARFGKTIFDIVELLAEEDGFENDPEGKADAMLQMAELITDLKAKLSAAEQRISAVNSILDGWHDLATEFENEGEHLRAGDLRSYLEQLEAVLNDTGKLADAALQQAREAMGETK